MAWTVDIEGNDITSYCQQINWHARWSRPATVVVRCPGHLFQASDGEELHLYENGTLKFSGPIWNIQPSGGPDRTDIEITAFDHLIYMSKRLCKQPSDGPSPFNVVELFPVFDTYITAPEIMHAFVRAALEDPFATDPVDGPVSAPLPWILGDPSGGDDVSVMGAPMNAPMTLDQMRQNLLSTGQLAINVTPGVGASRLDFVRPPTKPGASATTYSYQTGAFNSQNATYTDDMDEMVNALWYLLGPRGPRAGPTAPNRPRGIKINHWAGSITPTAANAGGDGEGNGEVDIPGDQWPPELKQRFFQSRAQYGYFQEIQVLDDNADEQTIRELFEEKWANEAWIRATPRKIVNITPERGVSPSFNLGEFITMEAGSRLNGGFSGLVQVFEFEVDINVNGVVAITQIIASDDGSGAASVGGG